MIPPRILRQLAPLGGVDDLAHHGVDLEDVAQPAAQELAEQHDGGVVSIHVAHLHEQLLPRGRLKDSAELGQRLARRLVEVDVLPGVDAGLGRVEQVAHPRLDEHGLEPRRSSNCSRVIHCRSAEGRLPRPALQAARLARRRRRPRSRETGDTPELARMRMAHADLADLDRAALRLHLGGDGRDDRRCEGRTAEPTEERPAGTGLWLSPRPATVEACPMNRTGPAIGRPGRMEEST